MNTLKAENDIRVHKVFIVDDHSVVREGLAEYINHEKDLTVCGEAEGISNTSEAIANCKPDIVIVDLSLEDGSGLRLMENLLYTYPDLLIMVLTMHREVVYAERCFKIGAKGYITKREPLKKIIEALREVLNGGIYVSEELSRQLISKLNVKRSKLSDSPFSSLTNREMEVYQLIGKGIRKEEIAEQLNLSHRTVLTYIDNIRKKMNLRDFYELVTHAVKNSPGLPI
jgi:DNA-binding NarL/FixJ family response regulator